MLGGIPLVVFMVLGGYVTLLFVCIPALECFQLTTPVAVGQLLLIRGSVKASVLAC